MVYIAIIGVYCIMFSLGCYFFLKHQCEAEIKTLEQTYNKKYRSLDKEYRHYQALQNNKLEEVKVSISKENKQYLSEMSNDVSLKIKELSDTIKNTRIV